MGKKNALSALWTNTWLSSVLSFILVVKESDALAKMLVSE